VRRPTARAGLETAEPETLKFPGDGRYPTRHHHHPHVQGRVLQVLVRADASSTAGLRLAQRGGEGHHPQPLHGFLFFQNSSTKDPA